MSSISIALAAWLSTLSAARRRHDGGEFGSIMIFKSVDDAGARGLLQASDRLDHKPFGGLLGKPHQTRVPSSTEEAF